jgi:exopolysaccharide biosynthesis polyprenyl glycosylphosphotransferase
VRRPLSTFDLLVKRAFDLVVALAGLILLSPMLLIVAAAIKLDGTGPILFRQTRHGYNNGSIRVFKFRTMNVVEDGKFFKQAQQADPRVTTFGRILRRTNIDELPQLLNVLLGEMSIVGPRPHPVALNERYQHRLTPFMRRHNIKPGITGWAQVNGCRGETDTVEKMQRRLEFDLYYIDNWSLIFDIQIILLTFLSKKAYTNAY